MTRQSARSRRSREILILSRTALALGLLIRPRRLLRLAGGTPDDRAVAVARVLGVRHLVQVSAQTFAWDRFIRVCALIDLLHAGSMSILAVVDRQRRRAATVDSLVASTFFAAEVLAIALGDTATTLPNFSVRSQTRIEG